MKRIHIPYEKMRELVAQHPFYEIARMYDVDPRTIGFLATRYGLRSAFVARPVTDAERATINEKIAGGWSIKRTATFLGRSQDCVARHIRGELRPRHNIERDDGFREGWPVPNTTMAEQVGYMAKVFEDVKLPQSHAVPLDGGRIARVAQAAVQRSTSTAAMCAEQ